MKKSNGKFLFAGAMAALAVLFTVLVCVYDVNTVSPHGIDVEVGFSRLNNAIAESFGYSEFWYNVTELLGKASIAVVGIYAVIALVQLIKRKSLVKIDTELYAMGGLFFVMLLVYVLFEKAVVNFRPMILPGEEALEASFPSSHTMLACVVFGSVIVTGKKYIKNVNIRIAVVIACTVILIVAPIGRLLSGVHWFTDVMGSILMSFALLSVFTAVLERIKSNGKNK